MTQPGDAQVRAPSSSPPSVDEWHSLAASAVASTLGVDVSTGLSSATALMRLESVGPNEIGGVEPPSILRIAARQFTSALTILLVVAAAASGFLLGEWIDAAAISSILVLNATIGVVQELRAARAIAALESLTVPRAHVLRDGVEDEISGTDVVPGDLLLLDAGDRIPADSRLVWVGDLEMDESLLTGESFPVPKSIDAAPPEAGLGDRVGVVFGGTTVAGGRARAVVVATGSRSEAGKVAALTAEREPATPLQRELNVVGRRLAEISIAAAVLVIMMGLGRGVRFETMVLTGVALAVAVIPEGLPTVVAVTLSRGMERMARRNAIIRRLSAVEALGAANVICTDKTGTLTENRLTLRRIALADGEFDVPTTIDDTNRFAGDWRSPRLLEVIVGCNDAYRVDGGFRGDPLDVALLRGAEELGDDIELRRRSSKRLNERPFDSTRKLMDVLAQTPDGPVQLVKGAPEAVIRRCDTVATASGTSTLDTIGRERLDRTTERLAESGLRSLALAFVEQTSEEAGMADGGLTFLALVGLADRPRVGVRKSVEEARRAGIDVVMVTGDHKVTALAIGHAVGIVDHANEIMTGDRLRSIDQGQLDAEIGNYRAFARVDPADKPKIVRAWQRQGAVVAMTGDGVNDGPALRAADIGVAMGSGTDVAKDSAAVVLQDDNFSTIVAAVREGRRIFKNLRNVVHYLLSANASEVFTMIVGFALFGSLGEPLRATQLLWINLVSDGLPALALGFHDSKDDVMAERPGAGRDVLGRRNVTSLLVQSSVLGAAAVMAIVVGEFLLHQPWIVTQTMLFTTLVIAQLLHAFNMTSGSVANLWSRLGLAVAGSIAAHVLIVNLGITQSAFSIVSLGPVEWAWAVGLAIVGFVGARIAHRLAPQ
ncbi:MAG: cation-translocating P-type ATPase [Acidimicrobiia bacterium]|nr:cation-translocating P-type ATPase [Acidimicrobiia bacterium]